MQTAEDAKKMLKGGEWMIKDSLPEDIFTPEDFNEEQRMVMEMCTSFLDTEIFPIVAQIDTLEPGLMPALVEKAGDQGLLSTSIPEEFGGLGKDFITSTIVNEGLGGGFSFSVAVAAHTGIGTLPILYFGMPKNECILCIHWSSSCLRWTIISAGCFFCTIIESPILKINLVL
jgi:hypothetical protein